MTDHSQGTTSRMIQQSLRETRHEGLGRNAPGGLAVMCCELVGFWRPGSVAGKVKSYQAMKTITIPNIFT
jgi:hypothetical protein